MPVKTYTKTGSKSTKTVALPKTVFNEEINDYSLLHQAYETYLANKRLGAPAARSRSDVRGGGRKPWRQKGTGRARAGSIRSPLWRGGGVTFGPTGRESHGKRLSKKSRQKAIRQALTLLARDNKISVIDSVEVKDGKTKTAAGLIKKLGTERNVVLVVPEKSSDIIRAFNNLANITVVQSKYLNVFLLLNADSVVITDQSLKDIAEWLSGGNNG